MRSCRASHERWRGRALDRIDLSARSLRFKTDEIVELAKVAAAYDGIYTSHMRYEDAEIYQALDEVFASLGKRHSRRGFAYQAFRPHRLGSGRKSAGLTSKSASGGLDITKINTGTPLKHRHQSIDSGKRLRRRPIHFLELMKTRPKRPGWPPE